MDPPPRRIVAKTCTKAYLLLSCEENVREVPRRLIKRLNHTDPAILMLLLTLGAAVLLALLFVTSGAVGRAWWIPFLISIALGYASARLLSPIIAIPIAAVAPAAAVCLVILIKAIAWPGVPAVGDGFHILVTAFAVAGALATSLTLVSRIIN